MSFHWSGCECLAIEGTRYEFLSLGWLMFGHRRNLGSSDSRENHKERYLMNILH